MKKKKKTHRFASGIEEHLARGNAETAKLFRFLYVDYYLEYVEQYKGTSELSNEAYIGVRGVRATHLDALKAKIFFLFFPFVSYFGLVVRCWKRVCRRSGFSN